MLHTKLQETELKRIIYNYLFYKFQPHFVDIHYTIDIKEVHLILCSMRIMYAAKIVVKILMSDLVFEMEMFLHQLSVRVPNIAKPDLHIQWFTR